MKKDFKDITIKDITTAAMRWMDNPTIRPGVKLIINFIKNGINKEEVLLV